MSLEIYNKLRMPPPEALKAISGGRMNGKTDINPMWRIKVLTEQFGVCGIGWKYEIVNMWLEKGGKDEISAFTQINLYIKDGDKWSDAIPGIGGSAFVALESKGLFTSDECYKMALTDALSVSCKALGVAADIYFDKDKTKYDVSQAQDEPKQSTPTNTQPQAQKPNATPQTATGLITDAQRKRLFAIAKDHEEQMRKIISEKGYTSTTDILIKDYDGICKEIEELKNAK